jgi:heptosyltransferase-1
MPRIWSLKDLKGLMADVLFIKISSLGDVIHYMPALTEARARRSDARLAWVVEEAFAPLVALHPAAAEVVAVAARRWRRAPWQASTWQDIGRFLRGLRARAFDTIIDTQGLVKTALLARAAKGKRHGYDPHSIKEPFACAFYDVRHRVEWNQHAIARNRALTGLALGYTPDGPPDFGLDRAALAGTGGVAPYGVLLHATARADKEWPEANWRMLAAALGTSADLVLPFGTEAERARASRIAAATARARVPDRAPLDQVARLIAGAAFVVGVDTGLLHLAAALGVPLVAIFCGSDPGLTGPMGLGSIRVLGGKGAPPLVGEVAEAAGRIQGSR